MVIGMMRCFAETSVCPATKLTSKQHERDIKPEIKLQVRSIIISMNSYCNCGYWLPPANTSAVGCHKDRAGLELRASSSNLV